MGRARIVANRGQGLYAATPLYDMTALVKEIADLNQQENAFAPLIQKTLLTMAALENDVAVAEDALNAVLQQWKDGLIRNLNDAPPIPTPASNDPITGLPWDDPAKGLEADLLAAINAARSAVSVGTVARNDDLDRAALNYMREQADTGRSGHIGIGNTSPGDRALLVGYAPLAVGEALAYGPSSAAAVITSWQRSSASTLLDAEYVDVGIGYVHEATYPMTHLWCAVFAKPGGSTPGTFSFESPAAETAEGQQAALNKIELPRTQTHQPKKLAEVAAIYARAAQKHAAALNDLARLYAEHMTRLRRLSELGALESMLNAIVIDVWACYYNDALAVGAIVYTAEVPGHWLDSPVTRVSMRESGAVSYAERSWNIVRLAAQGPGQLRPAASMLSASVFYDAAIEPGAEKWRPKWRYATITALAGNVCTVALSSAAARRLDHGESIDINQSTTIQNVPINYPPCLGSVFSVGDEVLLSFNFDAATAEVIGFRREPRPCPGQPISWEQL